MERFVVGIGTWNERHFWESTGICHGTEAVDKHAFDAAGKGGLDSYARACLSATTARIAASTADSYGIWSNSFAEGLSHKRPIA